MGLLREMGYGLDLRTCAATGSAEELAYVSPKSGRAVSREAAGPYRERLLVLPAFLRHAAEEDVAASDEDVRHGLALTGYFFDRNVFAPHRQELPQARRRFIDLLAG